MEFVLLTQRQFQVENMSNPNLINLKALVEFKLAFFRLNKVEI